MRRSTWDRLWWTRDRRRLWISEMEDRHLMNTIGLMLGRSDGWRGELMPCLLQELEHRRSLGRCFGKEKGEEPEPALSPAGAISSPKSSVAD